MDKSLDVEFLQQVFKDFTHHVFVKCFSHQLSTVAATQFNTNNWLVAIFFHLLKGRPLTFESFVHCNFWPHLTTQRKTKIWKYSLSIFDQKKYLRHLKNTRVYLWGITTTKQRSSRFEVTLCWKDYTKNTEASSLKWLENCLCSQSRKEFKIYKC